MKQPKQKIYRRKPKTFEDMVLGKGVLGDLAHLFFYIACAGAVFLGLAIGVSAAAGTFIYPSTAIFAGAAIGTLAVTALGVGRMANYFDDRNKLKRYNRFKDNEIKRIDALTKDLPLPEQQAVIERELNKNQRALHKLDEQIKQEEAFKQLERELERERLTKKDSWEDRVSLQARLERKDEEEVVARA